MKGEAAGWDSCWRASNEGRAKRARVRRQDAIEVGLESRGRVGGRGALKSRCLLRDRILLYFNGLENNLLENVKQNS